MTPEVALIEARLLVHSYSIHSNPVPLDCLAHHVDHVYLAGLADLFHLADLPDQLQVDRVDLGMIIQHVHNK